METITDDNPMLMPIKEGIRALGIKIDEDCGKAVEIGSKT